MKKLCLNCRNLFETVRHVPQQSYCADKSCQRARKIAWMTQKLASDMDYKTNQRRAQKTWQQANPDYWKKYREGKSNLATTDSGRRKRRATGQANKEGTAPISDALNGLYELRVISQKRRVKIDVYIVEMTLYKGFKEPGKNVKR